MAYLQNAKLAAVFCSNSKWHKLEFKTFSPTEVTLTFAAPGSCRQDAPSLYLLYQVIETDVSEGELDAVYRISAAVRQPPTTDKSLRFSSV